MSSITEALFHVAPGITEAAAPEVEQALVNLAKRSPDEQMKIAKMMNALASVVKFPDGSLLDVLELLNKS